MQKKKLVYFAITFFITIGLAICFVKSNYIKRSYLIKFHKSGCIAHRYYKNGKEFEQIDTYLNGALIKKTNLKNKIYDGWTINYYSDGKIKSKESFKNGQTDGPRITFYPNGRIEFKSFRKKGKAEGIQYAYYKNGKLRGTRNWVDDHQYGDQYDYYENKKLKGYDAFDILGRRFYLYRPDSATYPARSDGYMFSNVTYTKDNDSTLVLENKGIYKSIKDLYVTIANPPQYTTEIKITINRKICRDLIFPDSNTVVVKNAFSNNGLYDIKINAVFMRNSIVLDETTGELRIIKE